MKGEDLNDCKQWDGIIKRSNSENFAQPKNRLKILAFDKFPLEICRGDEKHLDLSVWTLLLSDECLKCIINKFTYHFEQDVDQSKNSSVCLRGINLSGGEKVSDLGLYAISHVCPNLSICNLENVFQITKKGLLYLVKACPLLTHITLSGCLGISGSGFAAVGQSKGLQSLKVSGCNQITTGSFMKIFMGCNQLEEIDLSYCSLITDHEIKLMSENCIKLTHINLKNCCQVSDAGIVYLSEKCKILAFISIARNSMASRVSDVALLALGGGCKYITSINLSGCEMITDAGISWLTAGCKNLQSINLSNCSKVTNGSMRNIGECSLLRKLVITNVNKVSDLGLRCLAEGCPALEYLDASGLYMLSDGANRNFGFEGIQSMAKAPCALTFKEFFFHGCFRISKVALSSLSVMGNVERLVLSGCTALDDNGMIELSKLCEKLKFLSLSACGNCVSNAMLLGMSTFLKSIQSLNLADCGKVGRQGLGSLSSCRALRHLNLSGCVSVTNDAILGLCEGKFEPGLLSLLLERCPKVSDTALTWIINGLQDVRANVSGNVSLINLSLKGTKVTPSLVKAVRDRFIYSTVKNNHSYFGFLALSRTEDRRKINAYGLRYQSAVNIQAIFRAKQDQTKIQKARDRFCKIKVASKLSSLWRGRNARHNVKLLRYHQCMQQIMTIKLQCWFRLIIAQNLARSKMHKRWTLVAPYASTKIQRCFRNYKKAQETTVRIKFKQIQIKMWIMACKTIQSIGRMYIAKHYYEHLLRQQVLHEENILHCCLKLQSIWRSYSAKKETEVVRNLRRQQIETEKNASLIIFRCLRLSQLVRGIKVKIFQKVLRHRKSTLIKKWYHERKIIFEDKLLKKKQEKQKIEEGALKIQTTWRCKNARIIANNKKREMEKLASIQKEKGFVLTTWTRFCLARIYVTSLRQKRDFYVRKCIKIKILAAIQISSLWRGKKGRNKAHSVVLEKKARWKQMWSDDSKRYFFYNQITGESRWRKPQDFLDLEERPICQNCAYYDAQVECADCNEYFCNTCLDAVHSGGARLKHNIRAIYDFYGKRVDYGDYIQDCESSSTQSCLWPLETEQEKELSLRV